MSVKKTIYNLLLMLMTVIVLSACSESDGESATVVEGDELRLVSATRATELSGNGSPAIQIYMAEWTEQTPAATPEAGHFFYNAGSWRCNFNVKAAVQYYIYGFSPAAAANCTISPVDGDYKKGAILTLTDLNTVSADDICLIVGVDDMQSADENPAPQNGEFGFLGKGKNAEGESQNFISLLLDHIFAGVDFEISVDDRYSAVRDIRLRKMELEMTGYSTMDITVQLTAKPEEETGEFNPVTVVGNPTLYGTSQNAELFSDEDGLSLPPSSDTPMSIPGCFWPEMTEMSKTMKLVSTYDVYDKEGSCVRKGCQATNVIDLSTLKDKSTGNDVVIKRGKQVVISLTVEPTYLYMLSDPDMDNPTVTVGN